MSRIRPSDDDVRILTPEELGNFISETRRDITESFLRTARAAVPAATNAPRPFLEDHLPEMLSELADYLKSENEKEAFEEFVRLAHEHGALRAKSPQYSVAQIRREFSIVREAIFDMLGNRIALSKECAIRFSNAYEAALAETISEFVQEQVEG